MTPPPRAFQEFLTALVFLTRFPAGGRLGGGHGQSQGQGMPALSEACWAFAPVGLLVGGVAGLALWLAAAADLHPLACALAAIAAQVLVTGALHEDGLADVTDGFGAGRDRARTLEIMRDPRVGSFGVLALVFSVGLRAALLAGVPGPGWACATLVAAGAFSRAAMPVLMYVLPAARADGLAKGAGRPSAGTVELGLAIGVLALYVLLPALAATLGIVFAALAVAWLAWRADRRLGGQTGDVLGAAQQLAEIAVLMAAAGWIEGSL